VSSRDRNERALERYPSPLVRLRRSWVVLVVLALLAPVLAAAPAEANSIERKRREAARIAERLDALDEQAGRLDEDYLEARLRLADVTQRVTDAEVDVVETEGQMRLTSRRAAQWAVRAYVDRSAGAGMVDLFVGGADGTAAYRAGYADFAQGNDRDLADALAASAEDLDRARLRLQEQKDEQRALNAQLEQQREELEATIAETEVLQRRVQGELSRLVAEERARRQRAAEQAAREAARREAAARQAARQSSRAGATAAARPARTTRPIPPPSPGAAGAVEAAMSVRGTPYRWATSDPNRGFDCSGLIIWAWARAGRGGLPHSSRALFANLPRVNIEDLQPGDLVFFGSPVHHAGMYIGDGQMVHAPRRGDVVKVSTIYRRDIAGATRP
jgi:peptidoglycan DL-endopeptidase CwlO